jgi:DNA processing protein
MRKRLCALPGLDYKNMETIAENNQVAAQTPPVAAAAAEKPQTEGEPYRTEARLTWLALAMSPGLGPKRIAEAIRQVETPIDILSLPLTALEGLRFPAQEAQFIFDGKARAAADAELERAAAENAAIISYDCPEYPERLKEIFDPPPVLWVRDDVKLLARPSIAVVGMCHPTQYGSGVAEMLSRHLAARKLLIVGMARGIDACAHKGALAARKPAVAVWGTGIDVVYPKGNRKLAEDILAMGGAIVSEVPMGTLPAPQDFPRRNRISSGLSVAVLVVEASEQSWTPNTLNKQGAKLVATWEDVWEDLPLQVRLELDSEDGCESGSGVTASLLPDPVLRPQEAMVLEVLRQDTSLQIDEILDALETQLTSSEVFTALFELEMAGRIRQLPGKNYVRTLG